MKKSIDRRQKRKQPDGLLPLVPGQTLYIGLFQNRGGIIPFNEYVPSCFCAPWLRMQRHPQKQIFFTKGYFFPNIA